jgi:DNA-binding NarL/FixJ family response regulator
VLRLVGLRMSNAEIAAAQYITAGTAKTHAARLLAKLDARIGYNSSSSSTRQAWSRHRTDRSGVSHENDDRRTHQMSTILLARGSELR